MRRQRFEARCEIGGRFAPSYLGDDGRDSGPESLRQAIADSQPRSRLAEAAPQPPYSCVISFQLTSP